MSMLQAQTALKSWHRQKWLAPRKLLLEGRSDLRSAFLPFWLFDTSVEISCTASVGLSVDNAPSDVLRWQPVEEAYGQQHYPWTLPNMQVRIILYQEGMLGHAAILGTTSSLVLAIIAPSLV